MDLNDLLLFDLEFEFPTNAGRMRFSACSGLGNLDVVVLCESDLFLTSFFFAILESNEAVLILVRNKEVFCFSQPGMHVFLGTKKPLGAVLVNFRCGGMSVEKHLVIV